MLLINPELGQTYYLFVDSKGLVTIINSGSNYTTVAATCIAIGDNSVIFGWKTREAAPKRSYNRHSVNLVSQMTYINNQKDYTYGFYCALPMNLSSKEVLPHPKVDGMFCKKCGDYSTYVEANQLDGSFICYNCR